MAAKRATWSLGFLGFTIYLKHYYLLQYFLFFFIIKESHFAWFLFDNVLHTHGLLSSFCRSVNIR